MSTHLEVDEKVLGRFFDASLDLMCVADFEGYFKRLNQEWTRTLGWTLEELMARPYVDFVHPDDLNPTTKVAETIAAGGDVIHFENRYRCRDGSYRRVMWRATPDTEKGLIYAVGRDVTNEKLAEQRMQAVVDNATAVIFMKDTEGRYLLVNRLYEQLFHVSRKDVLGKSDHDIFPEAMAESFRKNDLVVMEAGVPLQFEEVAPHDDGPHMYVSVKFPIVDAGGRTVALCGIATDITEMKRAEREVRDREARLQAVMDTALDGIIMMDEGGTICSFNAAAEQMFGFAAEEALGQNVSILMSEPHRSGHDGYVRRYLDTGEKKILGIRREVLGRKKDGSEFPFELSVSELVTDSGRIFTGMVHDISDRKRAEEDLKRSNEELEQFAYVASHDLKEPLRMISSYLQIIEKRYADKLDDEGREFFGFAKDGARRMRNLIEDLLEYARVGTRGKAMEPADSGRVLDDVCADLQIAIAESGATITRDPLPIVAADSGQLRKVFQNFLANAIKFRGADPPKIHIAAHRQQKDWVFSVSDNGIGIPPEHQERIFVIFQRLHTRERYEGTGIGLAVCKKIVERHGGRVWLESTPNVGTTFYFTLHAA